MGHTDTIQVYSVTVMTHVKALQARHSSQGTSEPITPAHVCVNVGRTTGWFSQRHISTDYTSLFILRQLLACNNSISINTIIQ